MSMSSFCNVMHLFREVILGNTPDLYQLKIAIMNIVYFT